MVYILLILNIILAISLISGIVKYRKLKKTFLAYKKAVRNIGKTLTSVRYGNFFEKFDPATRSILPNFSESIDKMLESIIDREKMISEYQADLSRQLEIQKEIEKIKEDFVATLTHDLKVPIIAEANMLNFLMEDRFDELTIKQKEAVMHLQNSNKELVELVEILLETYKLNEQDIQLNFESININRLIDRIINEMFPIAQTHSISLNFYKDCDESVMLDEFYMKRVLKNIILNAISFSNPNSSVDINIYKDGNKLIIKMKNSGKTIKEEELERIFDKYYSTTNKFRKVGTGLGLYLANKIIRAHKGKIKAESNTGENTTTLVISLPL